MTDKKWNTICSREGCENTYYVYPYKKTKGLGKFCSRKCYGLNKRGKKLSEEHKQKIGNATKHLWKIGTFDKPHIREAYAKQGRSTKGSKRTEEQRKKMSDAHKGMDVSQLHTPEAREKQRQALIGKKQTPESNKKRSDALKGREFTEEHRQNLSEAGKRRDDLKGENNRFWRGGVTDDPYPEEFTRNLKRRIRKRDNYECQCCGLNVYGSRFGHVHHIDGDKQNCKEENLVLICITCHNAIHDRNNITSDNIEEYRSKLK
jgi:predicted HNH restriction endonuclease